ncbi:MAG TPA: BTAD domain-containing putative transcriptional regulator, partial [Longimicrobium sp.]|nr:BTAD domain-containing putative transcriptional regulator [Longimicrobium sp.]
MFTLNLLGGASLAGPNGPVTGKAAQRRRLALLALLAAARGRLTGRERLIGLLWPEHPGDAARHLLSEALYVLRKELGEAAFVSVGDEVGLNGEVVRSDVHAFQAAMEAGELEAAARLYRGPFLDGFYLPGAPEFERWAESERDRLDRAHTRTLECLAEAGEREGRPQEAAEWWRRLAVADPYNSRVGVRLMLALDAAGERAAALWFAETHAALLRDEVGVEPGSEFAAAVERLKTEPVRFPPPSTPAPLPAAGDGPPGPPSAAPSSVTPAGPGPFPEAPHSAVTEAAAVAPRGETGAEPAPAFADAGVETVAEARPTAAAQAGSRAAARRSGPLVVLAGLVLAAAGLIPGLARPRAEPHAAGYDARRIAVLYFDDDSPAGDLDYLARGLTETLIHELGQVEALEVISRNGVKPYRRSALPFDSMVADLRVGSVVEGSVQRSGDSVRVTVQLVDAATKTQLESRTLKHPMAGVFTLEEAVAREVSSFLRRRLGREVRLRETRAGTRSEAAWRLLWQAREVL